MKSTDAQHWKEECLADRGYDFVKWEGTDSIWQLNGLSSNITVKVKPDGATEIVNTEWIKSPKDDTIPSLAPCMFGLAIDAARNGIIRT